ncbi:hypothetical protein BUALT_Bualt19G0126600 [Buddleja alternifolia]|uniref:RNase H type-1 domain-containing protein n=1 Tax=Buddleja alternifolia TaxID=168488 RepID=A0AAV6W7M7_9LAMI|nr:hypothetical protein BUALT_Bualt19G0126600 [Buddleja alternifolia]
MLLAFPTSEAMKNHPRDAIKWVRPDHGWCKLNTDGNVYQHNNRATAGGYSRTKRAIGFLRRLQKLVIEVDSECVFNLILQANTDPHPLGNVIDGNVNEDCRVLLANPWEVKLFHVLREGNSAADCLAKKGHDHEEQHHIRVITRDYHLHLYKTPPDEDEGLQFLVGPRLLPNFENLHLIIAFNGFDHDIKCVRRHPIQLVFQYPTHSLKIKNEHSLDSCNIKSISKFAHSTFNSSFTLTGESETVIESAVRKFADGLYVETIKRMLMLDFKRVSGILKNQLYRMPPNTFDIVIKAIKAATTASARNFKSAHKGLALKNILWTAARASRVVDFEKAMNELKARDIEAFNWLVKRTPTHWSRAYFSTHPKCDIMLNNMSESFNSMVLATRSTPIVYMLESIRVTLMKRIYLMRDGMKKHKGDICPKIQKFLDQLKEKALGFIAH